MDLANIIAEIQTKAGALPGILNAPSDPRDAMTVFPCAVCYAKSGELDLDSAGWADYFNTLICEIHVARDILEKSVQIAMPYAESLPLALLADPTLSGTVQGVREIRYEFGGVEWAGELHIGFKFEIDVKGTLIES